MQSRPSFESKLDFGTSEPRIPPFPPALRLLGKYAKTLAPMRHSCLVAAAGLNGTIPVGGPALNLFR
jgi:hypothetical protein